MNQREPNDSRVQIPSHNGIKHRVVFFHKASFLEDEFREVVGVSPVSNFLGMHAFCISFCLISVPYVVLELQTSKRSSVSYSWPWQSYTKMKLKGSHCVLTNQQLQRLVTQKYHRGEVCFVLQKCVE